MSSPNPIYDQLCAERGHNPLARRDAEAYTRFLRYLTWELYLSYGFKPPQNLVLSVVS